MWPLSREGPLLKHGAGNGPVLDPGPAGDPDKVQVPVAGVDPELAARGVLVVGPEHGVAAQQEDLAQHTVEAVVPTIKLYSRIRAYRSEEDRHT